MPEVLGSPGNDGAAVIVVIGSLGDRDGLLADGGPGGLRPLGRGGRRGDAGRRGYLDTKHAAYRAKHEKQPPHDHTDSRTHFGARAINRLQRGRVRGESWTRYFKIFFYAVVVEPLEYRTK